MPRTVQPVGYHFGGIDIPDVRDIFTGAGVWRDLFFQSGNSFTKAIVPKGDGSACHVGAVGSAFAGNGGIDGKCVQADGDAVSVHLVNDLLFELGLIEWGLCIKIIGGVFHKPVGKEA